MIRQTNQLDQRRVKMTFSQKANSNASDSELEAKIVVKNEKDLPYLYKEILKFEEWNRKNYL